MNGTTTANAPVTTTYGDDADGNQTSMTSANGNTSTYSYDHLGRQTQVSQPQVTLYTGSVVTPTQTTRYDGDDRVTQQTDANGDVTADSYDPQGRLVAETNPVSGTTVYTCTFGYNGNDLPITDTLANGVQPSAQYDPGSRLKSLSTTGATGLSPSTYSYGYNALDWTTSATGISGTDTITHNALGRITAESGPSVLTSIPGQTYRWGYDGNGNIITEFRYWDTMIWATTKLHMVPYILSEDGNDGAVIEKCSDEPITAALPITHCLE